MPSLSRLCAVLVLLSGIAPVWGQNPINGPGGQPGGQQGIFLPGGQQGNGPNGGQGGGADADFESLIDLIVSTVAPESWAENGGGEGEIRPYFNGVYVDPTGTLRRATADGASQLVALRRESQRNAERPAAQPGDARRASPLRCVSLVRLEREIARRRDAGQPLDAAMLALAGLRRAEYVFVFPATADQPGDLVIAGPAGDWRAEEGRLLATGGEQGGDSGTVVRLDDLIEVFRHTAGGGPSFGCTINPRAAALAEAQEYINAAAAKPLRRGKRQREKWLEEIRSRVGKQDIVFFDIDPASRVAQVIVEADHHMKQIGMGLADGVVGVESYLDSIDLQQGEAPPAFGVLRWWFSMNYSAIRETKQKDAFQLVGPGAKVLSENQLLSERGELTGTGRSDELTARFAASFTANFTALCRKYPVYSELRNVFDLALIATLIHDEKLAQQAGWTPTLFANSGALPLPRYRVPKTVETIANHRLINRKHIVAGVSGGVDVRPQVVIEKRLRPAGDAYGPLTERANLRPGDDAAWWWDAP